MGPMSAVRDYITFNEAAVQIEAVALHGKAGNIYHIASGRPVTVRDVLRQHLVSHGLDMTCVEEGAEHSNHAGYDVPVVFADISKTRQLLSMM
jgi:GDP-4-dehydro-6-deoxy-D-mannose reductase